MGADICRVICLWNVVYAGFQDCSDNFNIRDAGEGPRGDNEIIYLTMTRMKRSSFIISLLIITSGLTFSQDAEKISPYMALQYFKGNSDSSYLKATLTYSKNRMELPLPGMEITFFSGTGGEKTAYESTH